MNAVMRNIDDRPFGKMFFCLGVRFPGWVLGISFLIVSCGTTPQSKFQELETSVVPQEVVNPQAYYHFLQGSLAELNNENAKALEAYQAGRALDPGSIFLKFRIAKLHFSNERVSEAVSMAKEIPVGQISTVKMFLDIAKIFSSAGEHNLALEVFTEAERQFPVEDRVYLSHGQFLVTAKSYAEAEEVFHSLLRQVPGSAQAHYRLGVIALEVKTQAEAKQHFEDAIALNVSFEPAYMKLFAIYEDKGNPQESANLVETYLREVNSQHREFRLKLVRLYVSQHETDKALKHLDIILGQNPGDLHAQVRKAQIFGETGNFQSAIEELTAVLRNRPNELRVRDFLGLLYEEIKDYERAIQAYQANVEFDPTFFDSVLHLGFVSYRLKRNEDALSYLNQAVKLRPKRPEPYLLLGLTSFQMKDYLQAKVKLEEGIEQDPSNAELHFNLGTAYDKLDRFDEVVREMEQTLELDPEHADALNYLGYSYADRGINIQEAVSLTQRAVAFKPRNGYYVDSLGWALSIRKTS